MAHRFAYKLCVITLCTFSLSRASDGQTAPRELTAPEPNRSWNTLEVGSLVGSRVDVVALDQPERRRSCRVKSITKDALVCSRTFGGSRTYPARQIVALILPGDDGLRLGFLLGLNGALGAAIWATVVLAGPCPFCAVGTGVAALVLFSAAGAVLMGDDQPDFVLYLAPGQQLTGKLRSLQP